MTAESPEAVLVLLADGAVKYHVEASELSALVFCDDGRMSSP
ncbi:hypothetical protein [Bremerella cremea]|nr:hypothetical protein [Bremerella cremea]